MILFKFGEENRDWIPLGCKPKKVEVVGKEVVITCEELKKGEEEEFEVIVEEE